MAQANKRTNDDDQKKLRQRFVDALLAAVEPLEIPLQAKIMIELGKFSEATQRGEAMRLSGASQLILHLISRHLLHGAPLLISPEEFARCARVEVAQWN